MSDGYHYGPSTNLRHVRPDEAITTFYAWVGERGQYSEISSDMVLVDVRSRPLDKPLFPPPAAPPWKPMRP